MNKKHSVALIVWIIVSLCCLAGLMFYYAGRPLPFFGRQEIFEDVYYYRRLHFTGGHLMMVHIVTVDLRNPEISFLVTPPDLYEQENTLRARTTSAFLEEYGLQLAINGGNFTPWYSNNPWDYYPKSGDPVSPTGFTASGGHAYATSGKHYPTLYISKDRIAQFGFSRGALDNAISGDRMLVVDGQLADDLPDERPSPRTAIGYDYGPDKLILVVVDGRQPFYSAGATLHELGNIMLEYGAGWAMNLDGGGSSTLVMYKNGEAVVLNSPIHARIPGVERPVGNHFGIRAPAR